MMNIYGATIKVKEGYFNIKLSEGVLHNMFNDYEYYNMVIKIIEDTYKAAREVKK